LTGQTHTHARARAHTAKLTVAAPKKSTLIFRVGNSERKKLRGERVIKERTKERKYREENC